MSLTDILTKVNKKVGEEMHRVQRPDGSVQLDCKQTPAPMFTLEKGVMFFPLEPL
jgi:hypothetical protein